MAQKFVNYTVAPFKDKPIGQNVGICSPSTFPPRIVKCIIDWANYPKGAVEINLEQGVLLPIDKIRSVEVDNSTRLSVATLMFPDTQSIVEISPDSVVSSPVLTWQLKCLVFNERPSEFGLTTIYFNNFLLDAFLQEGRPSSVSLWQTTSDGLVENVPVYHAPMLGSFSQTVIITLSDTVQQTVIMNSPNSQGKFYITGMEAYAFGCYSDTASPKEMKIAIKDLNDLTIPHYLEWMAPNDVSIIPRIELVNDTMKFMPLNSLHTYVMQNFNNTTPGFAFWKIFYDWVSFD